jgi:uncharacterized delta-60 repeat protein
MDIAYSVLITRSGGIVVGGTVLDGRGRETSVMTRYRRDGSPDLAFGRDGVLDTGAYSGLEQPDGKLLLLGVRQDSVMVARVSADGEPDRSFGRNGETVIPQRTLGDTDCARPSSADLFPDGGIVVVGGLGCGGEGGGSLSSFALMLRADGAIDRGFADDGIRLSSACGASDVVVQTNGRIVIAGSTGSSDYCIDGAMLLTGLRRDGSLDRTFGDRGRRLIRFSEGRDAGASAGALDDRGHVVVAGHAGGRLAVARVDQDGNLDPSFGGDGRITRRMGNHPDNGATDLAIGDDGRLTMSASDAGVATSRFILLRVAPNGRPDTSFGPRGIRSIPFGSTYALAEAVAPDGDGATVAVGMSFNQTTEADFAIARVR